MVSTKMVLTNMILINMVLTNMVLTNMVLTNMVLSWSCQTWFCQAWSWQAWSWHSPDKFGLDNKVLSNMVMTWLVNHGLDMVLILFLNNLLAVLDWLSILFLLHPDFAGSEHDKKTIVQIIFFYYVWGKTGIIKFEFKSTLVT